MRSACPVGGAAVVRPVGVVDAVVNATNSFLASTMASHLPTAEAAVLAATVAHSSMIRRR